MLSLRRCETALKAILLLYTVAALYFQQDVGYADNCDYARSMGGIVSGPAGGLPANPPVGTAAWGQRYVHYYIPYWQLEPAATLPKTSAVLLWWPGVALNYCLFSSRVLYGPALSLLPKLLLVGSLWLLLRWIDRVFDHRRILFLLLLGVPYALVITSADYVAYLNTFYQESASLVFAVLFFGSLLWLAERPRHRAPLAACFVSLFLLTTAKTNTVYWAAIGVPAVLAVRYGPVYRGRFWAHYATWGLAGSLLASGLALMLVRCPTLVAFNAYDSLFVGALPFSADPAAALESIGLKNAAGYVGASAFHPRSRKYFEANSARMSFGKTLRVMLREPMIAPRMLLHSANTMHIVANPYLGRFPCGDPRQAECNPPGDPYGPPPYKAWILPHLWTLTKLHFAPRCAVSRVLSGIGRTLPGRCAPHGSREHSPSWGWWRSWAV